ncbi:MAG: ankyrin repeat domain-containing protein [Nitrosomonadales bacterium]|nr:ankyrin repeat domain-containing protein [Nitrosomonadales bacterium]
MKLQFKSSEVLILIAASVMSLIANLPDDMLGKMVDKKLLLAGLIALVVVALFRYLQIYLLLTITILAIGANLPDEMASALGISRIAMIVSLGTLIALALLNRVIRLLPVGMEAHADEVNDAREDLMAAIAKGDQVTVLRLLVMNVNVNFTENGTTPLHLAAEKGYPEIVRTLIQYGADYRKKNAEGKTALEIALAKKKFIQTTEILHNVGRQPAGAYGHNETRRADADLWQKQHHT